MTPAPLFHFFTLVTRDDQYSAMRASLTEAGFDAVSLYTVLDNREGNAHEPYSAITRAVREAQAPYVVFCHQDLLFQKPPDDLRRVLEELDALDPKWAVAGNAGRTPEFEHIVCLDDDGFHDRGTRPGKVLTLDENFLVIRRDAGVGCSPELSGFHLYATDLCLNAYRNGLTAYVVEHRLTHLGTTLDYTGLYRQARPFHRFWRGRIKGAALMTPSMTLVFTWLPFVFEVLERTGAPRWLIHHARITRIVDRLLRPWRPAWLPSR